MHFMSQLERRLLSMYAEIANTTELPAYVTMF
jgi:hypothetical protein